MRCLVAAERFFGDSPGGAHGIAWDVARLLVSRGHEVALLCGSLGGDPLPGPSGVEGVEVVRYRIPRLTRLSPFRWNSNVAASRVAARRYLCGAPWDLVSTHSPAVALALIDTVRARRHVHTVHSPLVDEQRINWAKGGAGLVKRTLGLPVLRRAERRVLERVDEVHVLSTFTRSRLVSEHGPWIEQKVKVLPWWADEFARTCSRREARARLGLPKNGSIIASIRRLVPRMGLDTLVDALAGLPTDARWTAAIGGDGPERGTLENLIRAHGMDGRVRLLGRLTDAERALLYQAADLFVVPSRSLECFGLVVLEALANGVPVLATSVGAIPEILGPFQPEWLFPPNDPAALSRLLLRFVTGALEQPSEEELRGWVRGEFGRVGLQGRYLDLLLAKATEGASH